jgi:haloalkane dehalogenase
MNCDISSFKHLYPFQSRFFLINGHRYHYLDEGSGPPVLMLHGNPTWSFYYRNLIMALAPGHRVIVPDHMGCGLSDKPFVSDYNYRLKTRVDDLTALMAHLDIREKITLIVHDWGGMIGAAWALDHLQMIARLVITNTSGFLPPGGKQIPRRLKVLRQMAAFAVPAVLGGNLFARSALYMAPYKKLSRDVKKGLIAPYNTWHHRMATLKFVQDIPLCEGDPSYGIVKNVDDHLHLLAAFPMLILWGRHDFVFDMDYYREWCRRFPAADAHLFDDAGHYLLEDVPEQIIDRVRQFILKR